MKKVTRILKALEKAAKEMLQLQREYNKRGLYIEKSELTGRNIEFTKNGYFPAKMREYVETGHGYFTPWHWFGNRFYIAFSTLNNEEQQSFIRNLHKYTSLFAAVKAGYHYNFPRIYEQWGYDPIMEEDKERYLHYVNIKLKKNIGLLAETIHDGEWSCACPGHHKVSRMKHNPW